MATPEELDAALLTLDQLLAEIRQVIGIFRELPNRARRLRRPLRAELRHAQAEIAQVLEML
jgi:hypothetical protein